MRLPDFSFTKLMSFFLLVRFFSLFPPFPLGITHVFPVLPQQDSFLIHFVNAASVRSHSQTLLFKNFPFVTPFNRHRAFPKSGWTHFIFCEFSPLHRTVLPPFPIRTFSLEPTQSPSIPLRAPAVKTVDPFFNFIYRKAPPPKIERCFRVIDLRFFHCFAPAIDLVPC